MLHQQQRMVTVPRRKKKKMQDTQTIFTDFQNGHVTVLQNNIC
jgi:hypothetical protein